MNEIPEIETGRLKLRAPHEEDFSVYKTFYANAAASSAYGGPLSPLLAWKKLAADLGHWQLRGYGMWSVQEKSSGHMVGGCGLVWPEGWPRSELTWWIIPAARRQGYALEASQAVIKFGLDQLGWDYVQTHTNDENIAARQLVEKLGGVKFTREIFPDGLERDVLKIIE